MPSELERSAREWFEEAERAYVEGHQACACCGGSHQVYKGRRGQRLEYYCPACDFYAFHDQGSGQFYAVAGRDVPEVAHPGLSMSQTTTL
ncbi:MAG TPA: hypothetical protein VKA46_07560 [Gemmataceae bacterium]|nr:hypothetical protein [Gemmataceae bacterium]